MIQKMLNKYILHCFVYITFLGNFTIQVDANSEFKSLNRKQRALLFPSSSTIGIFAAVAVPLDLPNRNVFMSYNFEANYNLPFQGNHYIPGPLQKFISAEDLGLDEARENNGELDDIQELKNQTNSRKRRHSLGLVISRKSIYKILEKKLKNSGFPGKACLLKIICETNSLQISQPNGVLGNIFQIIFTPSSSNDEYFPREYYIAENNGLNINCNNYNKKCPRSILDVISISRTQ